MHTRGAQESELRRSAHIGADLDVVPPDVRLATECLGGGFLGREAPGQRERSIRATAQVRTLVLGQDALPNAIAESLQRGSLASDGGDVDTKTYDHSAPSPTLLASAARCSLREPALDRRPQVAHGAIQPDEHGIANHGVADVQFFELRDRGDVEYVEPG